MIIALFDEKRLSLSKSLLYKINKADVYFWYDGSKLAKFQNIDPKIKIIESPPSHLYFDITQRAKSHYHNYFFSEKRLGEIDEVMLNYIMRIFEFTFVNYYIFRYSIKKQFIDENNIKIIAPKYLEDIYCNISFKGSIKNYFLIPLTIVKFFLHAIRLILKSTLTKNKIKTPDILYIRKKVAWDGGVGAMIKDKFKNKKIKFDVCYWSFGQLKPYSGYYFINHFQGSIKASIRALFLNILALPYQIMLIIRYKVPILVIKRFVSENYLSLILTNLKRTKVFCGVLVDNPFHILLSLNKKSNQRITSLHESFLYYPFSIFDYCHLDVYFSLNEYEKNTINKFGGYIGKNIPISFYRSDVITHSKGVSDDLIRLQEKYKNTLLIASNRPNSYYSSFEIGAFIKSIELIRSISIQNKNTLFILKEKKGELDYLNKNILNELNKLGNIYIIRSYNPKMLDMNTFEDLLGISDTVLSIFYASQTIWQALSRRIPAFGINHSNTKSCFSNIKYFEISPEKEKMNDAINYWLNLAESDWSELSKKFGAEYNLFSKNSYQNISNELIKLV